QENDNLSLSETSEILEITENNFLENEVWTEVSETSEILEITENNLLENEVWTEEELSKFKKLYYKEKDIIEKQDDDNQDLENEINLLQNDDFKKSFKKNCCEKNCLQTQVEYSVALKRYLNFKNLSKSLQDMYLLEIIKNSKKSKLTTKYSFEGKSICKNAFKTIYNLGDTRWKNLRDHFVEHDINLRINSKTGKVGNRTISFETVMKVITFIGNFAKQNGLPSSGRSFRDNTIAIIYLPANTTYLSLHVQYLEAIKTNNQFEINKGKVKISTSSNEKKTTIQIEKIRQKDNFNQLVEKKLPGLSAE
ncbi:6976_t:CDS:2, partial [Gigaspora margarita]